jgi:hypothetical protein
MCQDRLPHLLSNPSADLFLPFNLFFRRSVSVPSAESVRFVVALAKGASTLGHLDEVALAGRED